MKKLPHYLLSILIVLITITIVVFSLPFTEKYIPYFSANLNLTDSRLKEYIFVSEITFDESTKENKWDIINQSKNTLFTRLNKYGVEIVNIKYNDKEGDKGEFIISTVTSKDKEKIQSLLSQKGEYKIVLKKDEANFNDEKNPYAQYLPDNYKDTNLSKRDLRKIYVTKLKTTSNEYAYFGILKPWVWNLGKYDKFLLDNSGKDAGFQTDGFVTPFAMPVYQNNSARSAKPTVAFLVSTDKSMSDVQNIVLNSQSLISTYTFKEVKDGDFSLNFSMTQLYLLVSIVILTVILISSITFKIDFNSAFSTLALSFLIFISIFKITNIGINSISILLTLILGSIYLILYGATNEKLKITVPIVIALFVMSYPFKSFFVLFAPYTLLFILLLLFSKQIINTVLNYFRKFILR